MNVRKLEKPALYILVAALAILGGLALSRSQTELRESRAIIAGMENENRGLTLRLRSVQTAVDGFSERLEGDAAEAGDIADGIDGVIAGIESLDRILGELGPFLDFLTEVVEGAGP